MKKTLLVYYTFSGNTDYVAELLKENDGITVEQLVAQKEPPKRGFGTFLFGGKSALFQEDAHLAPLKAQLDDFEAIIIAFPVWAGTYPPAISSFLKQYLFTAKTVFLIACSASGNAERAFAKITRKLKGNIVAETVSLKNPLKHKDETAAKVKEFVARIG